MKRTLTRNAETRLPCTAHGAVLHIHMVGPQCGVIQLTVKLFKFVDVKDIGCLTTDSHQRFVVDPATWKDGGEKKGGTVVRTEKKGSLGGRDGFGRCRGPGIEFGDEGG